MRRKVVGDVGLENHTAAQSSLRSDSFAVGGGVARDVYDRNATINVVYNNG